MTIIGFNELKHFRLKENDYKNMNKIIKHYKKLKINKYDNISHYIRVAIIKLNREELKNIKR